MAAYTVDKTIDCKGLSCPMPIVRTKKAIEELQAGEVLEVVATDPGSVADVKSWAVRTGHQFLGTVKEDGVFNHYIRKSHPDEVKPEKKFPHDVSHEELMGKLNENPVILDVREPMEYAFGHIPGAKLVPFGKLEETIDELRQHQNEDVYVICRTGSRSDMACQVLSEKGFTNVRNVLPGMAEWSGPTEKETK
ncbi:sulfurtransferase TusA family protein [Aneurinibacillus terranovensis]|uniref:sulfurtransferase TusA family protein n=1 Tax=Aneurinibacillus terranovensis TaxID=278991 RepID=UPI000417AEE0|nr:sulfurtransferase TusA family protein [Aneurinibacillus terranovensis]